jgi:beta-fructofuranosidase
MQDTPFTGVQYFVAKNPMGPFSCFEDGRLIGDENGKIYSGRVVQGPDDHWYLMGFHNVDDSGQFLGYISDPMRIYVGSDGRLSLESMSTMEESI